MPIEQLNATTYGFRMPCGDLVKVGDEALPNLFKPHLMLNRWDEECQVTLAASVIGLTQLRVPSDQLVEYETKDCLLQYHGKVGEDYKLGGFAVDQIIFKKPKTNALIAPFSLNNVKAYYQPPLTQQEIDDGCIRPEKIVGSYAIYHATRSPMHASKEIAEKYKACKVGMWYRPLIWDNSTPRKYCWGELNVDVKTGLRTITIPKEFYETATYPITIDDDFGFTGIGGSTLLPYLSEMYGTYFTGAAGIGISMTFHGKQYYYQTKMALYEKSDESFVMGTTESTPKTSGWHTQNFTSAPTLEAIDYWLVRWMRGTGDISYPDEFEYDTVVDVACAKTQEYPGVWPDPADFTQTELDYKFSIYCTYTPGAPAAVMPWNLAPRMAMMTMMTG